MNAWTFKLKSLGLNAFLFIIAGQTLAMAQSTYFYFKNDTGVPDDAVYINLTAATNYSGLQGGSTGTMSLSVGQSYTLAQLKGDLAGTSLVNVPLFSAQTYYGGAQIFITLGQPYTGTASPPANIVSGLVEEYIVNGSGTAGTLQTYNNNLDTSYVNSISMPISFVAKARNNLTLSGTAIPNESVLTLNSINPVATPSGTSTTADIYNSLKNDPYVPSQAITTLTGSTAYAAVTSLGGTIGKIYGTTSIASSSGAAGQYYRDWSTPALVTPTGTAFWAPLIPTLTGTGPGIATQTAGIPVHIGSYQVFGGTPPVGQVDPTLQGTLFGFSTVGYSPGKQYSPFNPNNLSTSADPNNLFLQSQDYSATAQFVTDMNPVGGPNYDPNISSLSGIAGVVLTAVGSAPSTNPTGPATGQFKMYIKTSDMNNPSGIYGANPQYTITWTPATGPLAGIEQVVTQYGSNNLTDRLVGDLASVINMGGAANTMSIWAHAVATGTTANLMNTIFNPNYTGPGGAALPSTTTIGDLTSGQLFYLLSLQTNPNELAAWFGAGIQDNPLFYNNYGSDFVGDTNSYTYAYTDRLQNPANSPGLFYTPASIPELMLDNVYLEIDLQAGDFTFIAVPEPGVAWLMPFLLAGFGLMRLRSRRTA